MCRACRSISILDVRVSSQTPGSFWFPRITQTRPSTRSSKLGVSSRVPVVRALRLTWTLSTETLLRTAATELWMSSECLWLDGPLGAASLGSAVWWPRGLTQLVLYTDLDIPIENVLWPVRLQCLELRGRFNQPITGAVWPAFLRKVSFGMRFNQPIAGVVWPASVQQLSFLYMFNHPIAGVLSAKVVVQGSVRSMQAANCCIPVEEKANIYTGSRQQGFASSWRSM
ncbi:unnamed protein product [Ectocarpus fasciculatus]